MATQVMAHVQIALRTRGADPTCDPAQVTAAERALSSARTALMLDAPFYGAVALRLTLVANPRVAQGTCATDGRGLYFNPTWILEQSHKALVGLIAHEVMHVAHGHHLRRESRNPRGWNIATDHVINNELSGSGFTLPEDGLCDRQYRGWSAEEVYPCVYRAPPPPPPQPPVGGYPCPEGEAGTGEGEDEQSQQSDDDAPEEDDDSDSSEAGEDAGEEEEETNTGAAGGGAEDDGDSEGAGGADEEEQLPAGGVLDALDPVEDEQELHVTLVEAGMCAKAAGNLPAHCARLINELTRAHVDWQEVLQEFVVQNMREDYSMRRPNKRYLQQGIYLPSLRSDSTPELAFFGDNSGSINEAQFSRCVKAIGECVATVKPERTHVMLCDSSVNFRATFERGEEVRDIPTDTGGGGTWFAPPFDALAEEGITPACAVYYTADGMGSYGAEPDYPVLWLLEPGAQLPPWGQIVMLDNIREAA